MRGRLIAIVPLMLAMIAGCGEGYRLVPARMNIVEVAPEYFPGTATTVHDLLAKEGFEDLGKDTEMIALIQQANAMPKDASREQLARLDREYTYLNTRHHLRVVLSDYTNGVPPALSLDYTPTSDHFVELAIYDERPRGFGPYGLAFYNRLLSALKQRYGGLLREIQPPPPTDEAEYRRITTKNTIAESIGWSLALVLPLLITGSVSRYLLQKPKISRNLKRLIFAVINAWLVAPLPFPAAFIFVIPLPNLFAFPWTSTDYYSRVAPFAAVSFPVTLLVCAIVSMFLFRGRLAQQIRPSPSPTPRRTGRLPRAGLLRCDSVLEQAVHASLIAGGARAASLAQVYQACGLAREERGCTTDRQESANYSAGASADQSPPAS